MIKSLERVQHLLILVLREIVSWRLINSHLAEPGCRIGGLPTGSNAEPEEDDQARWVHEPGIRKAGVDRCDNQLILLLKRWWRRRELQRLTLFPYLIRCRTRTYNCLIPGLYTDSVHPMSRMFILPPFCATSPSIAPRQTLDSWTQKRWLRDHISRHKTAHPVGSLSYLPADRIT